MAEGYVFIALYERVVHHAYELDLPNEMGSDHVSNVEDLKVYKKPMDTPFTYKPGPYHHFLH